MRLIPQNPIKQRLLGLSAAGLTLIELLLAIAIAVLLLGVTSLVYLTTLNTLRAQISWRSQWTPAEDAWMTLQQDLLGATALRGSTNPSFVLRPFSAKQPEVFTLNLYTTCPAVGSNNDWRAYGISQVEYALQAQNQTGVFALIRYCHPYRLTNNALENKTEEFLCQLTQMQIELYNGHSWTNAWETVAEVPQAARVAMQIELPSGPRTMVAETLIPAGQQIQSAPNS